MSLLGLIPARGGSKRLPNKNLLMLGTKPLIAWTIEAALNSTSVEKVIVSTDDPKIAKVACAYGADVPFLRLAELSTDEATSADVMVDAIHRLPAFEDTILLQPTSPFRTAEHIDSAYHLFKSKNAKSMVSVRTLHEKPSWFLRATEDGSIEQLLENATDDATIYAYNGAMYLVNTKHFLETKSFSSQGTLPYPMDNLSSLDIDTEYDFKLADYFLNNFRLYDH